MTSACRVLVADDNRDSADSLVDLLRAMGHWALAAYDGRQAVDACARWHPDLAILDVQMPVLDGCAAARMIRRQPRPPRLVASFTGMPPDDEPMRSSRALFDVELSKPPVMGEIETLVERACPPS